MTDFNKNQTGAETTRVMSDAEVELGQAIIDLDIAQDELRAATGMLNARRDFFNKLTDQIDMINSVNNRVDLRYELCQGRYALSTDELKMAQTMYRTYIEVSSECAQYLLDVSSDELMTGEYAAYINSFAETASVITRADKTLALFDRLMNTTEDVLINATDYSLFMYDMRLAVHDQTSVIYDCYRSGDGAYDADDAKRADRVFDMFC